MVSEKQSQTTAVSIIAWFWCIMGVLMCAGGFGQFYGKYIMSSSGFHTLSRNQAGFWADFPVAGAIIGAFGIGGIIGGCAFMQRKDWGRKLLRVLTALLFGAVCGFAIYWAVRSLFVWLFVWELNATIVFAMVGILNAAIIGVPLGIILKKLGDNAVKSAMDCADSIN